jgi:radical SAM/Cys-rich protein
MGSSVSLKRQKKSIADPRVQLRVLQGTESNLEGFFPFQKKLEQHGEKTLKPGRLEILQINLGKMCNQTCKHCHVDAGPDRKEIMSRDTLERCLEVALTTEVPIIDLTGGAPEMNPHFRWFVKELRTRSPSHKQPTIIDRCNLTIIQAHQQYADLPEFLAEHKVSVVSSLPFYDKKFTDRQRGDGVFESSIASLQHLNRVGYGQEATGLRLDLVYNPSGAFLPPPQNELEKDFRKALQERYEIVFSNLLAITNLPISRFLDFLIETGNLDAYMKKLIGAFNPAALQGLMCRNTLSVGWDGLLYDCDFNQMLELPVACSGSKHILDFDVSMLAHRSIVVDQHCYGCTAGNGSSCGGSIT